MSSWAVSARSVLIEAKGPKKRKKNEADDRSHGEPPLGFRIVEIDPEEEREVRDPTGIGLSALADELGKPASWLSIRFALVMRERAERFRRVYFTEWTRAKVELTRLKREQETTQESSGNQDGTDASRDAIEQQALIADRCNDILKAVNETLLLLKPGQSVVDSADLISWEFDDLRENLRRSLLELAGFTGLDNVKRDVAALVTAALVEEAVVMPDDTASPAKRSLRSAAETKVQRRRKLAKLLRTIVATDITQGEGPVWVPEDERRERPGDRLALKHQNILLLGEPGTGKSTVARVLTKILGRAGILPQRITAGLIDSTRPDLVGRVIGETAVRTSKSILRALGTTVFVDELYALISGDDDDFGREAIDTIVPLLTQWKGLLSMIGAGYEDLIRERIFGSNPGFESRMAYKLRLVNYTGPQLFDIIVSTLSREQAAARKQGGSYQLEARASEALRQLVVKSEPLGLFRDKNARGALNLLQKIKNAQSLRVVSKILDSKRLNSPSKLIKKNDVLKGFASWVEGLGGIRVLYDAGVVDVDDEDEPSASSTSSSASSGLRFH